MIKTKDYKKFSIDLVKLFYRRRAPLRTIFELTYRCNFKCIHCYNSNEQKEAKSQDELKTKEVFAILRQLKDLGGLYIGFTGGEIFLRQDIFDILWFAKRLGFQIIILTNSSFIDEKIADELKRLAPNKVDITVHALDKEIFDKITQVQGSGERVFRSIDLLYQRNVRLGLKSCGMQENKDELVRVSQFARSLNVLYRLDGEICPRLDRSKTPLKHLFSAEEAYHLRKLCYPEAFAKNDAKVMLRKTRKLRGRNLKRIFNCSVGYASVNINPYGELNLCIMIDYPRYKILKGSLAEGWENLKDFVDGINPPKDWQCRTCSLLKYCSWCPAKGYLEDGNFFTCEQYSKQKAKFFKKLKQDNATKPV